MICSGENSPGLEEASELISNEMVWQEEEQAKYHEEDRWQEMDKLTFATIYGGLPSKVEWLEVIVEI